MEGNKRHPQFTLELDTKQTHFFVERTLLPRAPFARRGFIHIGKRQIKTRGFVETVLKSRKTFVVRRQKQSSIQTHFHSKLYGKYQLKAHTLIGIIYNARKNQDACRTNTTSAWVYASRITTFPLPYPSTPRILRRMRRITRRIRIRWRALCESFFFLILRKSLEPLSLVFRFALKNFFRESLLYTLRDDDDEVQHTRNNEKVS